MTDRHRVLELDETAAKQELRRRTRRGFLVGGVAALAGFAAYKGVRTARTDDEVPWPERRVLDFNGRLAHGYLSDGHLMPTYPASKITYLKPNGGYGLDDPPEPGAKLHVSTDDGPTLALSISDVKALPRVEMITRFCCIEGWSVVTSWAGARFSDFARKVLPPGGKLPSYVSMMTPDEEYYVGLDMKSALHPQTILAYEHNGKPLTTEHGAPLRLVIPVKYGIKNIKRIGTITFSDERPDDYWAQEGYDWFAGL